MGAPTADTPDDGGRQAVPAPWLGLGLLMAANVLLLAGLSLWHDMPFPLRVVSGVLGLATVGGTGWCAFQIARHLGAEVRAKERSAQRMIDAEARTRSILETAGDGIITYDAQGRICLFNKAAARIFAYEPEEVIGTKVWDLISGQTSEGAKLTTDEVVVLDKGGVVSGRRRDGTSIPLEPALSKVRVEGGPLSILVLRDLTERKRVEEELYRARAELTQRVRERTAELEQANAKLEAKNLKLEKANEALALEVTERTRAQEELRRSEERYHTLVQVAPDAILIHRQDRITFANPAALRLFGITADQVDDLTLSDLVPTEAQPKLRGLLKAARDVRKPVLPVEMRVLRSSGETVDVEAAAAAVTDEGEKAVQMVLRDITERKRAEAILAESERRQRALARQLLGAQESERRYLAQELHDEVGQTLTAIKITLQSAQRLGIAEAGPLLEDCIQLAEKTLAQVRKLSVDLRPAALDRLGLVPSIRGLVDREAQRSGLVAHFETDVGSARWNPDLETACFRVVQEALTNVVRHAKARVVRVSLREDARALHLTIQDDGVGFNVAAAHDRAASGNSLGLLGLHERVQLVGGRLEIDSKPGRGTTIEVHVPLRSQDQEPQPGVRADGNDSGPARG